MTISYETRRFDCRPGSCGSNWIGSSEFADWKALCSDEGRGIFHQLNAIDSKAYIIACHNSSVHISAAIVDGEYFHGILHDNLCEDQFLVLKRSQRWDLMDLIQRMPGCKEILSLLR